MQWSQSQLLGNVTPPSTHELLGETYKLYRASLGRWFGITAPASLLVTTILVIADQNVRSFYRSDPALAILVRFGAFFLAWLFGCLTLGAVATGVNDIVTGVEENSDWLGDGYQRARECLRPIALIAAFTLVALLFGMVLISLLAFALVRTVGRSHFGTALYWGMLVGVLMVAWLLSRFGMAIPLVIGKSIGGWRALKESVELSRGNSGYLFLLVAESVAGSFVASLAIRYAFELLRLPNAVGAGWLPWIYYPAVALASASVQPPMFIGFSVLAYRSPDEAMLASTPRPAGSSGHNCAHL